MASFDWLRLLAGFKELVVTAAAVVGIVVAVRGLHAWRRQLAGGAEWDLARRLLRRAYGLRDSLQQVRGMLMTGGEIQAAIEKTGRSLPDGADASEFGLRVGYEVRWSRVRSAASDLDAECLEAEALWGGAAVEAVRPLRTCVQEFGVQLTMYLMLNGKPGSQCRPEFVKAERVVFGLPNESGTDEFSEQLAQAVAVAEAFIRPRIHTIADAR